MGDAVTRRRGDTVTIPFARHHVTPSPHHRVPPSPRLSASLVTYLLKVSSLRVTTYNIHKCRGLDRRVRPMRIAEVLKEIDADVVALQEVVGMDHTSHELNQVRAIAEELDRKSTRLNSSHGYISYAVFCLN